MPLTTITSLTSSGWINLHYRLHAVVDDGDEENPPTPSSSALDSQQESSICAKRAQKYDIASGLAAFLAGTHEIDVHLGRYGIPKIFAMPSGNMWLSVVRPGVFRYLKHSHALVQTAHVAGKYQLQLRISEQVRAGTMEKVAADYWFRRKRKRHIAYPDPGPVPEVPEGVKPVDLVVSGRVFSFFRRSHLLLNVGKHRILFLERPGAGLTNKWIEWEARLLHASYPIGRGTSMAVEGVDYTVLMSHEDRNASWIRWMGANDEGCGTAKVDLDAILGLAPSSDTCPGDAQWVPSDGPTAQELAFIVLAFHPLMCSAISHRKWAIYLLPLKFLFLVWFCKNIVGTIQFLRCVITGGPVDSC